MHRFFLVFVCTLFFAVNADARSKKPRPADFDEIETLINEDSEIYKRDMQFTSGDEEHPCGRTRYYVRVDHDGGTIKHYMCSGWRSIRGSQYDEIRQFAYLNELDFKKAYVDGETLLGIPLQRVAIPCMADHDCNSSNTQHNTFVIFVRSVSIAKQIVELLKPN